MVALDDLLARDLPDLVDRLCALTAAERSSLRRQRAGRDDFDSNLNAIDQRGQRVVEIATSRPGTFIRPFSPDEWRVVFARSDRDAHTIVRAYLSFVAQVDLRHGGFTAIRAYERAGRVVLDHDETYVLAMISDLTGSSEPRSKADVLRDDPGLLNETFWRIFAVVDGVQVSLANCDRWDPDKWHDCVLTLLADGTIDRGRVIDRTLAALSVGTVAFRTAWFARLHDALAPTIDEIAAHQPAYAALLRVPLGSTVALALKCLERLDPADLLDHRTALGGLAAAVHMSSKATAIRAVRLTGSIAQRNRELEHDIGAVFAAGLDHHQADVQLAAVNQLMRLETEYARELTLAHVDSLAPAPAAVARDWLGEIRHKATSVVVEPPHETDIPTLAMLPVEPITDPAHLLECFAVLLENPADAELGERCRCAAARLGADPSAYTTLAKRARRRMEEPSNWSVSTPIHVGAALIIAAAGDDLGRSISPPNQFAALVVSRAADVSHLLLARERRQLAAEPTHTRGWIHASTLTDRLATGRHSHVDLMAATLRVWPQSGLPEELTSRLAPRKWPFQDPVGPRNPHASGWLPWVALAAPADVAGIARLAFYPDTEDDVLVALSAVTASPLDIPEDAALLLAGCLAAQSALIRAAAVDAAITLVPHRLTVEALAAAVARQGYRPGWANGLKDLSTAGHGPAVRETLTYLLPGLDSKVRGLNRLAELLLDEHLRQGTPVTDERLRGWLGGASRGSTRLAKAARQLLRSS